MDVLSELECDSMYKPGTFIMVKIGKDIEHSVRNRHMLAPAEVIIDAMPMISS